MAYPFTTTIRVPAIGIAAQNAVADLLDGAATDLASHQAEVSERQPASFEFAFPLFGRTDWSSVQGYFEYGRMSVDTEEAPTLEISFMPRLVLAWAPILFAAFAGWQITHLTADPVSPLARVAASSLATVFYCTPTYLLMRFRVRRYLRSCIAAAMKRQAT